MFKGWSAQFAPLRPIVEPLKWNSVTLKHLALWLVALGFVAGSEPSAVESLHHIHSSHGNKRHHIVPIAIHRSPASLRAGHSKYSLFYSLQTFILRCVLEQSAICSVVLQWLILTLKNLSKTEQVPV